MKEWQIAEHEYESRVYGEEPDRDPEDELSDKQWEAMKLTEEIEDMLSEQSAWLKTRKVTG